jgi:predicted DNA-binding transcriptional regulator AlpA
MRLHRRRRAFFVLARPNTRKEVLVSTKTLKRPEPANQIRLLDRHEVCALADVTYPTIWAWMIAGEFPRGRTVGGSNRVRWRSDEVDAWIAGLPPSKLKGDAS